MAASATRPQRPLLHRMLISFLQIAVLLYVGICALLYFAQNRLTYPRQASGGELSTEEATRAALAQGLIPWDHPTPGVASPQGYVRPDFAKPTSRGTIVVFHGNGGWAGWRTAYIDALTRRGFRVFLYEYPGYGGRPGSPSEKTIVPDAKALVRSLDAAGLGPVYVWGESLGAGVAAAVCADTDSPVQGLVLLTPWDNIANAGLAHYPFIPVRQLMTDKYDSIANLRNFHHPVCVIRSSQDEIIPPRLTLNLYDNLAEPKKMIVQQGCGHNDWPADATLGWWDEAVDFIAPRHP